MKTIVCIVSLLLLGYFSNSKQLMNVNEIEVSPSLTIHVEGAVLKEGDYTFEDVVTIEEALVQIGTLEQANLSQIPLQNNITPELLIYVPYQKEGLISLNHASLEELQTIKGIGPKKAQAIIEGRPYTCLEDLMKIKGIGQTTYRKLREFFCL